MENNMNWVTTTTWDNIPITYVYKETITKKKDTLVSTRR